MLLSMSWPSFAYFITSNFYLFLILLKMRESFPQFLLELHRIPYSISKECMLQATNHLLNLEIIVVCPNLKKMGSNINLYFLHLLTNLQLTYHLRLDLKQYLNLVKNYLNICLNLCQVFWQLNNDVKSNIWLDHIRCLQIFNYTILKLVWKINQIPLTEYK